VSCGEAYSRFVEAFRAAAEKLRRRDFMAKFPAGSLQGGNRRSPPCTKGGLKVLEISPVGLPNDRHGVIAVVPDPIVCGVG
jgi:hypothetical protein